MRSAASVRRSFGSRSPPRHRGLEGGRAARAPPSALRRRNGPAPAPSTQCLLGGSAARPKPSRTTGRRRVVAPRVGGAQACPGTAQRAGTQRSSRAPTIDTLVGDDVRKRPTPAQPRRRPSRCAGSRPPRAGARRAFGPTKDRCRARSTCAGTRGTEPRQLAGVVRRTSVVALARCARQAALRHQGVHHRLRIPHAPEGSACPGRSSPTFTASGGSAASPC